MLILGVESSCDDTAAAVLMDGRTILSNVVSSQDQVHGPYGGVVPELASRQHIQSVLPIVDSALKNAGVTLKDVDGIAVTYGPGLVGSLLVGLSLVKGISFRTGIPYVGVNHLEAHCWRFILNMMSPFLTLRCLPLGATLCSTQCAALAITFFSAARATTRPAKLMTRWRSCSGLAIPADGPSIIWPRAAIPRRFDFRARS
jgi:hypothetical protein